MNGLNLLQQYIKEQELTGVILISPINLHYLQALLVLQALLSLLKIKPL